MRRMGWGGALLAAALVGAGGLHAQRPDRTRPRGEAQERTLCRCVDANGNPMDRYTCFVLPDMEAIAPMMAMAARRVVLGVNVRQDQPESDDDQGARLYGVEPESPAGKAGLEEDDIIVRVGDQPLLSPLADARAEDRLDEDRSLPVQRLLAVLADREPGDRLDVEYLRGSERRSASVELAEPRGFVGFSPEAMMSFGPSGFFGSTPEVPMVGRAFAIGGAACPGESADGGRPVIVDLGRSCVAGVELLELNPGLAKYFGGKEGVLVANAGADNPLGLRAGDVLLSLDGRAVRGVEQALRVLSSYESGEEVDLQVRRKEQTLAVKGRLR